MDEISSESSSSAQMAPPNTGAPAFRDLLPSLLIDAALPAITYQVLTRHGVAQVAALAVGAVFPAANLLAGFIRRHTIDLIGAIVLGFIAVGTITSLVSGNVFFILIKESIFTGIFGAICLCSLLWNRPLMFYFGRQFAAGDDPDRIAWWNARWEHEGFRSAIRTITVVWGVGYILEAIARVIFVMTLAPAIVVAISPIMAIGVTVLLIIWTRRYGQAVRERRERAEGLRSPA
jgi:hypothetical protein